MNVPGPRPPPRQLPACDFCYSKKTRCDRNDPCFNCVTAKVACLRHRPRQTGQNRNGTSTTNDRLAAVMQRMSQLEENLRRTSPNYPMDDESQQQSAAADNAHSTVMTPSSEQLEDQAAEWPPSPISRDIASRDGQPSGRKRPAPSSLDQSRHRNPPPQPLPEEEEQSPEDKVLTSLDLNRYLRPASGGLNRNREMDPERQGVLESAISLAKQAMSEPDLESDPEERPNFYEPSMYPSAEFLHLLQHVQNISKESTNGAATTYFLGLFASTTSVSLEQMALALIDCTVHGQQRIQYLICVNHAAYTFLTALDSDPTPLMRRELLRSKKRYRNNIVTAVSHLDTTVRPEVSLLYALQSGALLMQDIGRMRMCWKLNTLACRVGAALRGRSMAELGGFGPDDVTALRLACIRSYIFDTALSANNYQPACLARMDIDRTVLDTERPGDAMSSILLSLSEVQEVIIHETRKLAAPGQRNQMDTARLGSLKQQMKYIRAQAQEYRAKPQSKNDSYLQFEWLTIDFMYYSMMTSITRLSSTGEDPNAHHQCLENARKSLLTLRSMLEAASQAPYQDRYLSSLAWVVPLFPLRPLFFVFTNVIETSDAMDLKILQDIAKALEGPAQSLHSIMEIQRLCTSLLNLYADFAERSMCSPGSQDPPEPDNIRQIYQAQGAVPAMRSQSIRRPTSGQMAFTTGYPTNGVSAYRHQSSETVIDPPIHNLQDFSLLGNGPPIDPTFFDQQVNWELFFTQPVGDLL